MNLESIALDRIDSAYFNPPTRTTETALRSLYEGAKARGILVPVHLVKRGSKFDTADGHRRIEVARKLGMTQIRAIVHPEGTDLVELWSDLSLRTKSVRGYDWMCAWYSVKTKSGRDMPIPTTVKTSIDHCLKIFGMDGIPVLISNGTPPSIHVRTNQLYARLMSLDLAEGVTRKGIGFWIIRHGLDSPVATILNRAENVPKDSWRKVRTRIISDAPFNPAEIFPKSRVEKPRAAAK